MSQEIDYSGIGRRIRRFRTLRGMSQQALAEKTDISVTHMSHIETASTKLSLPVFINIAKALNVRTEELLHDRKESDGYTHDIEDIINTASLQEQKIMYDTIRSIRRSFGEQNK